MGHIERNEMNIKDLVEEVGYAPKRKATCHGGEFCCPCPFCKDGDDRFLIWPQRHNKNGEYQGGRYSCRVCGRYGDAISFLCDLQRLNYREACAKLQIAPKQRTSIKLERREITPPLVENPPETWQQKATLFVDWCHIQLMNNPVALNSVKERGLLLETVIKFKLGCNPQDFFRERPDWGVAEKLKDDGKTCKLWLPAGITIPTISTEGKVNKIKIRRLKWQEGDKWPKYVEVSGSKQSPSTYGNTALSTVLVLESELDALLIQQEIGDLIYCVALGGSTKPLDAQTDLLLKETPLILFLPDFDEAGAIAWVKWKKKFPRIHRVLTPLEKSAGDAFLAGVNLREWIMGNLEAIEKKKNRIG